MPREWWSLTRSLHRSGAPPLFHPSAWNVLAPPSRRGSPPTFFRSSLKGHLNRIFKLQHTSLSTLALSDLLLCFISLEHVSPSDIYLFI